MSKKKVEPAESKPFKGLTVSLLLKSKKAHKEQEDKENSQADYKALLKKIMKKVIPISQPQSRNASPQQQMVVRRGSDIPLLQFQSNKTREIDRKAKEAKVKAQMKKSNISIMDKKSQQVTQRSRNNSIVDQCFKYQKLKNKIESAYQTKENPSRHNSPAKDQQLNPYKRKKTSINSITKFLDVTTISRKCSANNSRNNSRQASPAKSHFQSKQPSANYESLGSKQRRRTEELSRNSFNLKHVIGRGGFGKVWKVQHKLTHKQYALKEMSKAVIITKKSVPSTLNQRKLLTNLKNQFIVNMLAAFQDRENLYLLMDLMPGGDLRNHISKHRRFNEEQTKFIVGCIVLGLQYIHQRQIIHRDIKPQNLVLDDKGYLKITDFGIARIFKEENSADTSGTPGYMAPQVMCRQNHTFAVDFFAVGILGFEFMTGKRPYLGRSRKQIRDEILARQVQLKRSDIPEGWSLQAADFINRLIQRKPSQRLGFTGAHQLKRHPWLRNFPWGKLQRRQLSAPFVPSERRQSEWMQSGQEWQGVVMQNRLLLRRDSVQGMFDGYQYVKLNNV